MQKNWHSKSPHFKIERKIGWRLENCTLSAGMTGWYVLENSKMARSEAIKISLTIFTSLVQRSPTQSVWFSALWYGLLLDLRLTFVTYWHDNIDRCTRWNVNASFEIKIKTAVHQLPREKRSTIHLTKYHCNVMGTFHPYFLITSVRPWYLF